MNNLFLANVRVNNGFIIISKIHLVEAADENEASNKVHNFYEKKSEETKRKWKIISLDLEPSIK